MVFGTLEWERTESEAAMNVLLVDDEPMMRKMVKLTLEKRGFQVFDSPNGKDALCLLSSEGQKIEVLVTDVVMEDMDGWALARSLAERHPDLPVLFTSGYPINFENERQKRQHLG